MFICKLLKVNQDLQDFDFGEKITRKWWFFLFFIVLQFVPPYTSKGYEMSQIGIVIGYILSHALIFSYTQFYLVFKVIPILLVILIIIFKNKVSRIFSIYVGFTYVLFAFLQSISVSEKYGVGIVTDNLVMFLIVAIFWFWEAIVNKNDFTPHKRPLWKYWMVPLAILAFWFPLNPATLEPDFNPIYLFSNSAGLAFCLMTPVYLTILILYYPKINRALLRVTSLVGVIIGFYNLLLGFFTPERWWLSTLHIPLLVISTYGLVLSFKKIHYD